MATSLRNQFTDYFFSRVPFVDHIIFDTFSKYGEQYSKIFHVKRSGRAFENVLGMVSLGYLRTFGEDEAVSYDKVYQGPKSQYIHIKYGLAVRTSEEAMDDDVDGIMKTGAASLGRSAAYTPEIVAADVINNGESAPSGQFFTAPRGEALFSASHALPFAFDGEITGTDLGGWSSGVYSNLGSADFSITALRAALTNISRTPDERGKLVRLTPNVVYGAPEMQYIFQEVLNSDGKSGTADNDLNAFKVLFNLSPFQWHYLSDVDAFYLLAMPGEHELNFFWRKPFTTDHDTDFDTGGGKSKITGRFSAGYSGWRGTYASTP